MACGPQASPSLEDVYRRAPRMVSRRIAGQAVLVPVSGNVADVDSLYTLNRVGAFLWERFDGRQDGHAHVAAMLQQFEVDRKNAETDYLVFVAQLLEIGALITNTPG